MLRGLVVGGLVLGVAAVFPEGLVFPFFVMILGLFCGVLPGVAMARPEESRPGLEWAAAVLVLGMGMTGLWLSPLYLVAAWLLHGLWGSLHRVTARADTLPAWYPGFCITFDLVMGGFVIYMWLVAA